MNDVIRSWFEKNSHLVDRLAWNVFANPEVSGEEAYACEVTAEFMKQFGFQVETFAVPPAKVNNGIRAVWGSGSPVIGILGEYDALPGLGQEAVPYRAPKPGAGHGCGHNLMNAGCAAAAAALRAAMETEKLDGTVVFLGCPAEEGLSGKVHMMKDGWFDGVDLCIAWHDGGPFRVAEHVNQSMMNLEFVFRGRTAHAACNPQDGRSALDAAQLMNMGVEFLREHLEDAVRIHYVFNAAGDRPNVVPDVASLHYYIRSYNKKSVDDVFERVCNVARGASLMTGTKATCRIIGGGYEPILNFTLNDVLYEAAKKVPDIVYDEEDYAFAKTLYESYNGVSAPEKLDMGDRKHIYGECDLLPTHFCKPLGYGWAEFGSTDVNDVSQLIPTVQMFGGNIMGVGGHSWGVTASSGSPAGRKSCIQAGKYMAQFGLEVLKQPEIADRAKEELRNIRKNMEEYKPILATDEMAL